MTKTLNAAISMHYTTVYLSLFNSHDASLELLCITHAIYLHQAAHNS